MKHLFALIAGLATGAVVSLALLLFVTPSQPGLSPLDVGGGAQISLDFSGVAEDAILITNNGDSTLPTHPYRVPELWEPTINESSVLVTTLQNTRGEPIGLGIKFVSLSEKTRVLNGEMLADSVWHVYLPGRGTLLVEQSENYWAFLRDIVLPAHWNSNDSWRGNWQGTITSGPGPYGTARVYGGSGEFRSLETEAIETLTASAFSAVDGPVALEGRLLVDLPEDDAALSAERR